MPFARNQNIQIILAFWKIVREHYSCKAPTNMLSYGKIKYLVLCVQYYLLAVREQYAIFTLPSMPGNVGNPICKLRDLPCTVLISIASG